jgi:hypothetical protein
MADVVADKSGICHHLCGIYTVCYMDWLQMVDKYIKLCVVSFYSVYLPVRGINLFQLLSDMSYPVPVLDTGPQENWRYQKIL